LAHGKKIVKINENLLTTFRSSAVFYIWKSKPSKVSFNRSCWVYTADGLGSSVLLNCLACCLRVNNQSTKPSTVFHFSILFDTSLHCSGSYFLFDICPLWFLHEEEWRQRSADGVKADPCLWEETSFSRH